MNPDGSFNLPCNVFFTNGTPDLNDAGQIAIKLDVIFNTGTQNPAWDKS